MKMFKLKVLEERKCECVFICNVCDSCVITAIIQSFLERIDLRKTFTRKEENLLSNYLRRSAIIETGMLCAVESNEKYD